MENVSLLSKHLSGECCLLFTNKKGVEKYFEEFTSQDFANAGTISKVDIKLEKGFEAFEYLSYSIEPYLRELQMPTKLTNQKIELYKDVQLA